jgi:hypothetical protein
MDLGGKSYGISALRDAYPCKTFTTKTLQLKYWQQSTYRIFTKGVECRGASEKQIPSLRYGMTNNRRYGMTNKDAAVCQTKDTTVWQIKYAPFWS